MKVGIIGLGRMGEGMSRRMMKAGIETWGYRRNFAKAEEAYEAGYVSGVTTSIGHLCQVVKEDGPGVFQMVVPAENVEDTIDELLQHCGEGDIIIDHGNSNFKDSRRRALRLEKLGIQYIDCGTSGGVYGLERGYCLMVGGSDSAVSVCAPIFRALAPGLAAASRTDATSRVTSAEYGWLHCGPAGAGHFVKMVHNGVEYGIMQAYAEGFNILNEANAGAKYTREGDAEVAPMSDPENYQYDIDCAEVQGSGVVEALLVVGCLILPLMLCVATAGLISLMVEYRTPVKVAGLLTLLLTLVFPLRLLVPLCLRDLILADSEHTPIKF